MLLGLPSIAIIIKLYGKVSDPPAEARWDLMTTYIKKKRNKLALLPNLILVLYFFRHVLN